MLSAWQHFTPPSPEVEKRIDAILAKLTLEEKIDLLGGHPEKGCTCGNQQAGIPELKMSDGPAGVHWWTRRSTTYPASICSAASWDRDLALKLGAAIGRDARARGIHILLAPGVNIYRSPLCGRNFEYLGEDPYLAGEMVVSYIRGVQGMGVAATVKHYAVNYQEFDRHGVSSDVDERTLHEIYLPAFRAAIIQGGCGALMTAYNPVNGVHCSEHRELIMDILKGRWGFDGVVMSDWVSTYSTVDAANNGLDLEMPRAAWMDREHLLPAIREGKVTEATIDDKVRRLLRMAICFGWLDHDQLDPSIPEVDPQTEAVALEVAQGGIVLLKNEDGILPFGRDIRTIAVVGPSCDPAVISGGGSAYNTPTHTISILEGIRALAGESITVLHARGPDPAREWQLFTQGGFVTAGGSPGLEMEVFENDTLSGTPILNRTEQTLDWWLGYQGPVEDRSIPEYSIRWSGFVCPRESGPHVFYVNANDAGFRLLIDGEQVLERWSGDRNGTFSVERELITGQSSHIVLEMHKTRYWVGIHLGWEYCANGERERVAALETVRSADAVVMCTGFNQRTEAEGFDRGFELHPQLEEFILNAASINPNTVVVMTAGGNVAMERWIDKVKGLVWAWYPGQEGGTAVAQMLFGEVNPSGKLPVTFERRLEDRSSFSCYHDEDNDKRVQLSDTIFGGYRHVDRTGVQPLFPFGFGLSYTTFSYENITLSADVMHENGCIVAGFDIRNTGTVTGAEVAQLYIAHHNPRLPRPVKELKNFTKVKLFPGQCRRVELPIDASALMFYDPEQHGWVYEPGDFEVLIGASCRDIRLRARFTAH